MNDRRALLLFGLVLQLASYTPPALAQARVYYDGNGKELKTPTAQEIADMAVMRQESNGSNKEYALAIRHNFSETLGAGYLENIGNPAPPVGQAWVAAGTQVSCGVDAIVQDIYNPNSRLVCTGYKNSSSSVTAGTVQSLKFDGTDAFISLDEVNPASDITYIVTLARSDTTRQECVFQQNDFAFVFDKTDAKVLMPVEIFHNESGTSASDSHSQYRKSEVIYTGAANSTSSTEWKIWVKYWKDGDKNMNRVVIVKNGTRLADWNTASEGKPMSSVIPKGQLSLGKGCAATAKLHDVVWSYFKGDLSSFSCTGYTIDPAQQNTTTTSFGSGTVMNNFSLPGDWNVGSGSGQTSTTDLSFPANPTGGRRSFDLTMYGSAKIEYRWQRQYSVRIGSNMSRFEGLCRIDENAWSGKVLLAGSGQQWFDKGTSLYLFPISTASGVYRCTGYRDNTTGEMRDATSLSVYSLDAPVDISFQWEMVTQNQSGTPVGQALTFSAALSSVLRTDLEPTLDTTSGTGQDSYYWDPKNKKLYPLVGNLNLTFNWTTTDGGTVPVKVSTAWPTTGLYTYVIGCPPVPLDPSDEDSVALVGLRHTDGDATISQAGEFSATLPGWSTLMFTKTYDGTAATGDLGAPNEYVYIKAVDCRRWSPYTSATATVGGEITNLNDSTVPHNGCVYWSRARYNVNLYDRASMQGQIFPVNEEFKTTTDPTDDMLIVWYSTVDGIHWPTRPYLYTCSAPPKTATTTFTPNRIVIASREGSEGKNAKGVAQTFPDASKKAQNYLDPARYQDVQVYAQNDASKAGYNPNEEHALAAPSFKYMSAAPQPQAAFALRNDLNVTGKTGKDAALNTSQAYVLLQYYDTVLGKHGMAAFWVEKDDLANGYIFQYSMKAGDPVVAPYPLNLVIGAAPPAEIFGKNGNVARRCYWEDHKGQAWAVSGNSSLYAYLWYPLDPTFWYNLDEDGDKLVEGPGEPVPWLPVAGTLSGSEGFPANMTGRKKAVEVTYTTTWPTQVPILKAGETVTFPGGEYRADHPTYPGLPGVLGWAAGQVVFDDLNPTMNTSDVFAKYLIRLAQVLEVRSVPLAVADMPVDLQPASGNVSVVQGFWFFKALHAGLKNRVFYDPLTQTLRVRGFVNGKTLGDDGLMASPPSVYVVQPDILTLADREVLEAIPGADSKFKSAVRQLWVKSRNPNSVQSRSDGEYVVGVEPYVDKDGKTDATKGQPLMALGPGLALIPNGAALDPTANFTEGYAVLAENNHASLGALPVALHIVKVVKDKYRGALKTILSDNVFDEKITLRHTADFGANAEQDMVFQWWYREADGADQAPPSLAPAGVWKVFPGMGPEVSMQGAGAALLVDNLFFCRYRHKLSAADQDASWSDWAGAANSRPPTYMITELVLGDLTTQGVKSQVVEALREQVTEAQYPNREVFVQALTATVGLTELNALVDPGPPARTVLELILDLAGEDPAETYQGQLADGWVKRVLNGLNPFEARVSDFYASDSPATYVSMVQQAGSRFEGAVAFNPDKDVIENVGLIEMYQTVLDRAMSLSLNLEQPATSPGITTALLLAASRIAGFYTLLGNEAYTDAMDPTIGYGTSSVEYGSLAPTIFSFMNQVPTLLDEELCLLRGRDEEGARPVYNRLLWNFTKGEGEVAYALSYNVQDVNKDGFVDEADGRATYPQGHGDAWGHYLTALKGYYDLLSHPSFNWQARSELFQIEGVVIDVDYSDERKFAETAAAKAKVGKEVLDLTYREKYVADPDGQWQGYQDTDRNRAWGVSEWGRRAFMGAYFDWVTANAILPPNAPFKVTQDTLDEFVAAGVPQTVVDKLHSLLFMGTYTSEEDFVADIAALLSAAELSTWQETLLAHLDRKTGLQQIDRKTVPELQEIAGQARQVQQKFDEANTGINPLGVASEAVPFDVDPSRLLPGAYNAATHFEQYRERADKALQNAQVAFDYANDLKNRSRQLANSAQEFAEKTTEQDRDYRNRLIEIFGTPYEGTIGTGKPYPPGYQGPDYFLYMYVDVSEVSNDTVPAAMAETVEGFFKPMAVTAYDLAEVEGFSNSTLSVVSRYFDTDMEGSSVAKEYWTDTDFNALTLKMEFPLSASDYSFAAPKAWGMRRAPGEIQVALSELIQAEANLQLSLSDYNGLLGDIDYAARELQACSKMHDEQIKIGEEWSADVVSFDERINGLRNGAAATEYAGDVAQRWSQVFAAGLPTVVGLASDATSGARSALLGGGLITQDLLKMTSLIMNGQADAAESEKEVAELAMETEIQKAEYNFEVLQHLREIEGLMGLEAPKRMEIFKRREHMRQVSEQYRATLAKGLRLLEERKAFNAKVAAKTQGKRYLDMAFRVGTNNALSQYRAMFDVAARYAYLAARVYDYETNLGDRDPASAKPLMGDLMRQRTLGQYYGGQYIIGLGGLGGLLARMDTNYQVLKTQMGFNNPQTETGRMSLRRELLRIKADSASDAEWQRQLEKYRVNDLWAVPEFRRFCRPFAPESAGFQPGIVIPFSTNVIFGKNFFGWPLSGGDHAYDPTNFVTKVRSVGLWFENYDNALLAETPRAYLVPAGIDIMYVPDSADLDTREWTIVDQKLPVPLPVSDSNLNNPQWVPMLDGLDGSMVEVRRYSSFRAYHDSGYFDANEMSYDSRVVGRSVWNTRWLLIIPGGTFLADSKDGLDTFIHGAKVPGTTTNERDGHGVTDIKLFFQTYAYSGN